jgi:anthranilate synthase component 2
LANPKVILIDNFDSFTFNVKDYLERAGALVTVLSRVEIEIKHILNFDAVVFSPGPGNPENLPDLMRLVRFSVENRPTFGICLGFQAIAHYFGSVVKKGIPMHGKLSRVLVQSDSGRLIKGLPSQFEVVRYHSLGINEVFDPLKILLKTENGEIMAIEHNDLNVSGVQFHPEAHLTQFGFQIIRTWVQSL